jgi:four helix bundle protein
VPRFESLEAWQKAHQLALGVYALSRKLPEDEKFGLTSQLRRAAVSAAANIAEGRERTSDADFGHFLDIAAGSVAEVQYFLILGRDLGYWPDAEIQGVSDLAAETIRVIRALRDSVRR